MVRQDAEALRRRLYAPGAADDDVDRYREAGGSAEAQSALPVEVQPRRPRPYRPRILVAAVLAALVVIAIGVSRVAADPRPSAPAPTPLAVDGDDRADFERNLALGNAAGIAAWLLTTPPLPLLRSAKRLYTVEDRGVGPDTVTLAPVPAAAVRGRATVFLVVDRTSTAGWTSLRREVDASGEQRYLPQVHRASTQAAGDLTVHGYRYTAGDRPVEVRVDAPDGVRWGLAVVFTD